MANQADTPSQGFTEEQLDRAGLILGTMAFSAAGLDDELRAALTVVFEEVADRTNTNADEIWGTKYPDALEAVRVVADEAANTMHSIPGIVHAAYERGELSA